MAFYCPGATVGNPAYPCPNEGYTAAGASSASQCVCPANAALNTSSICECVAGYYYIMDSSSPAGWRCGQCPANFYCPGNGDAYPCPASSTSAAQSTNYSACICAAPQVMAVNTLTQPPTMSCGNCPSNQYYISNTQCGACPTNSTSPPGTASASGCTCVNGMYVVTNAQAPSGRQCNPCLPGFYCEGGSATACPPNFYCPSSTVTPNACPALSTAPSNSNSSAACVCNKGYFMQTGACVACSVCTQGNYALANCTSLVNTNCAVCPAGSYCAVPAANTPVLCSPGTYCPAGSTAPSLCAAGYYCPSAATQFQCH